jgi:hypothetical protein
VCNAQDSRGQPEGTIARERSRVAKGITQAAGVCAHVLMCSYIYACVCVCVCVCVCLCV